MSSIVRSWITSTETWEEIHRFKRDGFLQQTTTAEDYLQSFRSLVDTMVDKLDYENEYLDTIRDFDFICGTYFEALGMNAYEWNNEK